MAFSTKAWYEDCYVSVAPVGGSEVQLCTKTTSMSISGGNFDIEGVNTFCGKITKLNPKEDIEISFEGLPVSVQDFDWIYHGVSATSTAITSSTAVKYRVSLLWTDQVGITSAVQAINTSSEAYRRLYADAYCTGVEYSMDAQDNLSATMTFKLAYEDSNGVQNFKMESCDTSSALAASGAYTTSNKF